MINLAQKAIYNMSTAVPLLFICAIVWWLKNGDLSVALSLCLSGIFILILFCFSFAYGKKHLAPIIIRTNDISPSDGWIVGYILSYILPLASVVFEDFDLTVCSIIAILLLIAIPFVNTAVPNPILFAAKYHFYNVSAENGVSGYILISKRKLRRKQDLKCVNRMCEFLLLDVEE